MSPGPETRTKNRNNNDRRTEEVVLSEPLLQYYQKT